MKLDLFNKRHMLGRHISGFPESNAIDYCQTDRLLRLHLAEEIALLCEGLTDVSASLGERKVQTLNRLNQLRVQIGEDDWQEEFCKSEFSAHDEERLLDFDLVLLERIAGLKSCLSELQSVGGVGEFNALFELFEQGVAEALELMEKRTRLGRELFAGGDTR